MTTEVDTTATATGPDPDTTGDETTVGTETTAGDTTTAGEGLACPQLLWVGAAEMASGTDVPLVERAQAIGFEITFVLDSASLASDADGQCAVVISGTADSVDVVDRFHDVLVPVITWEYGIYDDMDFVAAGLEGVAEATNAIDVLDPAHPLAAGYPAGMLAIFTGTGRIGYAMGTGAHVVAALPGQPTTATLFEYQPGEILADGSDATGLRIALPIMSAPEGTLEPAGIDLFEAALRRATQP